MSLFDEFEVSGDVFLPSDQATPKRVDWDYLNPNFSIGINIIQLSPEERVFFSQELAEFKANVDSEFANLLIKGVRIRVDSDTYYEITNIPVKRKLFPGFYTIRLKPINV